MKKQKDILKSFETSVYTMEQTEGGLASIIKYPNMYMCLPTSRSYRLNGIDGRLEYSKQNRLQVNSETLEAWLRDLRTVDTVGSSVYVTIDDGMYLFNTPTEGHGEIILTSLMTSNTELADKPYYIIDLGLFKTMIFTAIRLLNKLNTNTVVISTVKQSILFITEHIYISSTPLLKVQKRTHTVDMYTYMSSLHPPSAFAAGHSQLRCPRSDDTSTVQPLGRLKRRRD